MEQFATSKNNITYYLGAGASAEAMPLVNEIIINGKAISGIPQAFGHLANKLKANQSISSENIRYYNYIISNLIQIAEKSLLFGTIDTYAKYLFLTDKVKLKDLKNTIIFFFLYKQCIERGYDKRTLIFLTTVLQDKNIFPPNIKLLSWNYDFQMEIAAENFVKPSFNRVAGNFKRSRPLLEHFPSHGKLVDPVFDLIHLNGCAGYYQIEKNYSEYVFDEKITNLETLFLICQKAEMDNFLNFAWEKNSVSESAITKAEQIAEITDVLVVIGYTFPVFNREIDNRIFRKLNTKKNLKIYFQDPVKDGKFIKDQFGLDNNIDVIHIPQVHNFHIPIEL